jgi:hypothetical protein
MLVILSVQFMLPLNTLAITGGPSQPEFTSFTPVEVTDMVDLFTGDFQYNIPLLDIDGYPINLSYASGIGMEDQAGIVGLGWTLNAGGIINRTVRGIPDDFNGKDNIVTTTNLRTNWTAGVNFGVDAEPIGAPISFGMGFGIFYNNYSGPGFENNQSVSITGGDKMKAGATLDLGYSSESGHTVSPAFSLSSAISETEHTEKGNTTGTGIGVGVSAGLSYNSRSGLRGVTIGTSASASYKAAGKNSYKNSTSIGTSATIPTSTQSYVPQITAPINSTTITGDLGLGGEVFWVNLKGKIGGYYNEQRLSTPVKASPAYGYLYSHTGQNDPLALHDFNREKEGVYTRYVPSLPMAQMTYDIYTASGQGVSGMYRPFRDVGTVYDPFTYQSSQSGSFGADVGFGAYFKVGGNIGFGYVATTSGPWSGGNKTRIPLSFRGYDNNNPAYEPAYFKSAGDFSIMERDYFDNVLHGIYPIRVPQDKNVANSIFKKQQVLSSFSETDAAMRNDNKRLSREGRNQTFSFLTVEEAKQAALDKSLYNQAEQQGRQAHHIAEITVSRPDGVRYIYGSQTYNFRQDEVTFNVDASSQNDSFVEYKPGDDNSSNNTKGLDYYFNKNYLPPHATAYQLTAIVSPDYVDVTGDGLTTDDLGTYTKFSYVNYKGIDKNNPYNWRNPYYENTANFNEGLKFKTNDDKGAYLYGEKEIKVLDVIETKNYIAVFHYSDRLDAWEVKGENGGRNENGNTLPKLDNIQLYSKYEYKNGNGTPLKTVHFEYNYSLCPNIPSYYNPANTAEKGGKLTLEKVYFTYGDSKKGMLSPYVFKYDGNNPPYSAHNQDRWGTYKNAGSDNPAGLNNIDHPYTLQDRAGANNNVAAWALKTIQLPSGGEIAVEYEADDYAFVQDKRAANMVQILGIANSTAAIQNGQYSSNVLYNRKNSNNLYLFFRADEATSESDFRKKYLGTHYEPLYYKVYANLTEAHDESYIVGYVDYTESGWDSTTKIGWIKLKEDEGRNPIAKDAMQFVNVNASDLYYGGNDDKDHEKPGEAMIRKMVGQIDDLKAMFDGVYDAMTTKGIGKTINPQKSFLRLKNTDGHKLGGGARVKKLTISDAWGRMRGNADNDFKYGQKYEYNIISKYDEDGIAAGTTISSGVAVYEPMVGGDENSMRNPRFYIEEHKKAQSNKFYIERPYGESFFPSPSVGYSHVKVTSIANDVVQRTATGHTEHEFYTAKDFPIIMRSINPTMGVTPKTTLEQFLRKLLNLKVTDFVTATQGYTVELNDMHGKQKSQKVYAEGQAEAISSVEYFYKTDPLNSKQLSNDIQTIDKNAKIESRLGGITVDMVMDEREWWSLTSGGTVQINVDTSPFLFGIPFPIPVPWFTIHSEETRFRSLTTTKIITRYGMLEETSAQDLGSYVTTENLAWDKETGEVLLTKTSNAFKDPVYSFTYPAHWGYDGMAPAYKNIGLRGKFNYEAKQLLTLGDELLVNNELAWVTGINGNDRELKNRAGNIVNADANADITLLRSGRRNQQSTAIGTVTTMTNPIVGGEINFNNAKVLNAGAVEFNSDWKNIQCESNLPLSENPYITGEAGNYRPKRSWVYLTGRTQTDENRNTNLRTDGAFTSFSPFWKNTGVAPLKADSTGWTFATEVTMFNPNGFEIENRDALKRYTSASYGYNNMLPISVSSNTMYKEGGFTGFEDTEQNLENETKTHFEFPVSKEDLSPNHSHTGKYSIRVATEVELEKDLVPCE